MQLLHMFGRPFQAFRRIGTLSTYRLRTVVYPRVQFLNFPASPVTISHLSSRASIRYSIEHLEKDVPLNIEQASDVDRSKQLNSRADLIFTLLQNRDKQEFTVKQVQKLFRLIKSDPDQLSSENVIKCVTAYVKLSLAVSSNVTERNECLDLEEYCKFEMHVKENLGSTSLPHLVMIYNTFFECQLRHPQTVFFHACEKLLRERVSKVTEPDEVIALCQMVTGSNQEDLWKSIADCTSLFLDQMSKTQLMSCLHSVSLVESPSKTRKQLYNLIMRKILEHEMPTLKVNELSFLMWTMKKFGMTDTKVLQKICEKVMQVNGKKIHTRKRDVTNLCYLLGSLNTFQWAQNDVFDLVVGLLLNSKSRGNFGNNYISQVIINAANLNIHLAAGSELIQRQENSMRKATNVYEQVHYYWALCVMDKQGMVSEAEIKDLFHPSVLMSVEEDAPGKVLKLLRNLRDIAMTMDMPLESLAFLSELKRLGKQRLSGNFESEFCCLIERELPEGSYSRNVVTPAGHVIDIELYVNDAGEAVALKDEMTDIHRIAVKTRGYFALSKPNNLPLGWVKMENRNLVKEGYTVLEIPHYEWLKLKTLNERMAFIKGKIKEAVPLKTEAQAI